MSRPSSEMQFQKVLEQAVRDVLADDKASPAEKCKAIAEGRALLEITIPKKSKSGKGMFDD